MRTAGTFRIATTHLQGYDAAWRLYLDLALAAGMRCPR